MPRQGQQPRAQPADLLVRLGRVHLGDQTPAGVLGPHRPVGHQHVAVAIIGGAHRSNCPAMAARRAGILLAATSVIEGRSRGGSMSRIVSPLPAPTSTSPVFPRPAGP